jgi:hypothetical protein
MKRLKILVIVLVIIAAVIGGGVWYSYYRVIPRMVGKALVENTEPTALPNEYKVKIRKLRKPVNRASEKIIREIDSLDIPFSAILRLIDETENETIVQTITELKTHEPSNPNEVFNIVKQQVPSPEFDLEVLRKPFLKYATMERYDQGIQYIDNNQVIEQIEEMPFREIVKEVLIQKRAELDRKMKAAGGPGLK